MTITREQIEAIRAHHTRILAMYAGSDFAKTQRTTIEICDLAIEAIDNRADARLGAQVRARIVDAANDDGATPAGIAFRIRKEHAGAHRCADVWAVFDAIYEAFQEEAADGE